MNFEWTDEERQARDRLVSILDATARERAGELDQADPATFRDRVMQLLSTLAGSDYLKLGLGSPGSGSVMTLVAAREVLADLSGSLFLAVETSVRLFGSLACAAGGSIGDRIVGPLLTGELIGAIGLVDSGDDKDSDPHSITRARQQGPQVLLSGRKPFITNGPIADWVAVVARLEDEPVVAFVEARQEGLTWGPRLLTLGLDGLTVAALDLDGVAVPAGMVWHPPKPATVFELLQPVQDLMLCQLGVGIMRRAFEAARSHARSKKRAGKPILHFQEVGFKLADMLTLVETAQLLVRRAAWLCQAGDREAPTVLKCAKVFASEAAETVTASAMQIAGGCGYLKGHPTERSYREAGYPSLAGTTSELCRMAIAQDLLRQFQE